MITATTKYGILEGKRKGGQTLFSGVPYAKPPVGDRRFREAVPPEAWEGIRPALAEGPACLQLGHDRTGRPRAAAGSAEDCLYLNVRTPAPLIEQDGRQAIDAEAGLPVYVFVHGGAYEMGSAGVPLYDGRAFADKGIVYVGINYRLGIFGSMLLTSLEEESPRRRAGCYGISDVQQALTWVHENIRAFGGDPERVTLGGESAGAFLVSLMLHTEAAGAHFQRAILESGTARGCAVKAKYGRENRRILLAGSQAIAAALGAADSPEGLALLRAVPAEELLMRWAFLEDGTPRGLFADPAAGLYLYGEDRLPDVESIEAKVDLLFGFNTDEGTMFADPGIDEEGYLAFLQGHYPHRWEDVARRFPVDATHSPYQRMAEIIGIGAFSGSMLPYADRLARNGGRVYAYHFDYLTERLAAEGMGVRHIAELHFVFHRFLRAVGAEDEAGEALAERMNSAWASFIKNGDPADAVLWPRYTPEEPTAVRFGHSITTGTIDRLEDMRFLEELLTEEYGE